MKQLSLDDIRSRLSAWLDPSRIKGTPQVLSVPFGRFATTPTCPPIASTTEAIRGGVTNPGAGDIIAQRENLTPGVYDVWWNFSANAIFPADIAVNVEDGADGVRWGVGFVTQDSADQPAAQGQLAFMVPEQDDAIVFRLELAVTGVLLFNAAIVQRLP